MKTKWLWGIVTIALVAGGALGLVWMHCQPPVVPEPAIAKEDSITLKRKAAKRAKEVARNDEILQKLAPRKDQLPRCDKVELFSWQHPELEAFGEQEILKPAEPIRILEGEAAEEIAALWRAQSLWCIPLSMTLCHYPVFGLRLHPQGAPPVELSFCWTCGNVYFVEAGKPTDGCSFATTRKPASMLRAKFEALFPEVISHLPNMLRDKQ